MEDVRREFLDDLLTTPSPSGYEVDGQRRWIEYVEPHADEVRTDDYGNAVAVLEGEADAPSIAVAGHGDEIGYIVRKIDDEGFVHLGRIGGSDRTVSRGQHVTIHGEDGPVNGVIGQTAIHLRENDDDTYDDIAEQRVDVGAEDGEEARELVEVGDAITISSTVEELNGSLIAGRGLDNRVGTWVAAETLRRAAEADVDATVYAISTVQEEVGLKGAKMIGDDLAPDAVVAVDVYHATDYPDAPGDKSSEVALGDGPVVGRGSANHPAVVDAVRAAADDVDLDVQIAADGIYTGTDADAFFTQAGGTPSLNLGLPNRYMHTPVEVVDTEDLDAAADVLAATAERASESAPFSVDL
ncbi:peptidase M42 family protein [Salinarchaeum sp. Harcht-Bsk1]|uniref:M20/M25/M40 family metallo-hydrolase n=1 Tax=Salinarchaeum sp. Harcht-Bsk1 TaxID=1333523 RepID=UPI0003423FA2|nr:M20/M25/M40 family metallo-hydrolase [Salinarchaeum sp. Harcht-Bsk1]AGN02628.1 peptidase M42 family protein [Salinarchaeum sp. Harcht-Bsk1]